MNIYLLRVKEDYEDFESYDGHVVQARNSITARKLCPYGEEGDIWEESEKTTIKLIGFNNQISEKEMVILSSFNAA